MKRILSIAMLLLMALPTLAQRSDAPNWISIAGKVGVGNSILLCKQISDNENISTNYLSPSFSIGGRLGVVFVDRIGVSVEYLSSTYQNKYEIKDLLNKTNLNTNLKLKTGDLLILARYTGEYGFYFEAGPKITSVKEVNYERGETTNFDLTNCFNGSYNSIVVGLGLTPFNGERVQISLGVRAAYCSKNVIKQPDGLQNTGFTNYRTMEMKPFSAQVMVDINYHFARFGSATCGKQKIIFFK
ncbi:MAG: hypothetical protein K6F33_08165 [Bacteroidales bacterium]|nr:hypothetical protein [Bacteroidales bacterium]